MGSQGEIYNILGLKLPAEIVEKDKIYLVNGKTIAADEDQETDTDFVNVIPTAPVDLKNPNLVTRILGHSYEDWLKGEHFRGQALVGYVVANEHYLDCATQLPQRDIIEGLRPRLIKDLKEKLDYDAKPDQLELYLMFDLIQSI
jgi:hypothetical protein